MTSGHSSVTISRELIKVTNVMQNKKYSINKIILELYSKVYKKGYEKVLFTLNLCSEDEFLLVKNRIAELSSDSSITEQKNKKKKFLMSEHKKKN